ncbi:MAG TPA: hypothetical protein VFN35_12890, partial [Ktedonobacteraceae bacterium]|nr:hypothetical protein [Ktedonobacteraceae bacterium]
MKYVDIRDLPPCSFSPQCLRLIDDLDVPAAARSPARLSHIADFQDERQLRQLRSHVPGCPTCSALLLEARRLRSQQRLMLHRFLIANEKRVPSTTSAIFAAIQREQIQSGQNTVQEVQLANLNETSAHAQNEAPASAPIPLHARFSPQRSLFQNVLTLATVAAVILAAMGLFYRFSDQSTANSTPSKPTPRLPSAPGTAHYGWDSVVIGLTLLSASSLARSFTVYNFNVVSSQMKVLFTSAQQGSMMDLEAVSSDGQSLLYRETTLNQQETYKAFSL